MNKTVSYIKIILMVVIPLMVIAKIYLLDKIDFDIDTLGKQLAPVQKYIKPNCTVGFYDNTSDPTLIVELYYLAAPHVIINSLNPDTLLLIQFNSKPIKTFEHYRVITQNQDNGRQISLITKAN
ncbi:MAG: hypothetical protein ABIN13_06060 [Mucilaginibacter sp.]